MTRKDQIKMLEDKIKANERQYDLDRKNAASNKYCLILVVTYLNMSI